VLLGSIKSMQGETVIKEYNFPSKGSNIDEFEQKKISAQGVYSGTVGSKKGTASVCVTNKRLIARIEGKAGIFSTAKTGGVYQINIKDVGDVRIAAIKRSKLLPILLILFGIITLIAYVGIFFIVLGIILLVIRKPQKILDVKSKGGAGAGATGFLIKAKFLIGVAGGYDEMASEIGALIADLQTYGDDCISSWR